jgi:hypothetical protein
MDKCYLSQLPIEIRTLVDRLEEFADKKIKVVKSDRDGPATHQIDHNEAIIGLRDLETVNVEAFLHELLHIERTWPEKTPLISARDKTLKQAFANLDNRLEHLVILPRMNKYGYDATQWWNNELAKKLERKTWEQQPDAPRRANLLLMQLSVDLLVTDEALKAEVPLILQRYGLTSAAQAFAGEIRINVEDKIRMTAAAARNEIFSPDLAQLEYFDPRSKAPRCEPIP